jgi:hypothetical protein
MSKNPADQTQPDSTYRTDAPPARPQPMEECLKVAAQIRQELEGRTHSNSTELVTEERQR